MSKKQSSASPLAEDAAPLEIPESETVPGLLETHAVEGAEAPALAPVTVPVERETVIPTTEEPIGRHVLDAASIGSKVVVVRVEGGATYARLADPATGIVTLPKSDPAAKLPAGARIVKSAEDLYVAVQMDPAEDYPPLVTKTAGEAIAGFVAHFHPSAG